MLAGGDAHLFAADWSAEDPRMRFPTLEEALGFVADYETGRGAPFDAAERAVARAALLDCDGLHGRCEHADALIDLGPAPPTGGGRGEAPPAGSARAFAAAHAAVLDVSP